MHSTLTPLFLAAIMATSLRGQTPGPATAPVAPPASASSAVAAKKLPSETLTVIEAKSFLALHEAEKRQYEADREAVLAKGAKLKQEQRLKLIQEFVTANGEREKKLQADMRRAAQLSHKVRLVENPIPAKPTPKSGGK
jgi:hypothetical protein